MGLLGQFLKSEMETMLARGIRLRVIGETRRLPAPICNVLEEAVARTAENDRMVLTLALSYGARNELVRAARALAARVAAGELAPDSIDDETFASALDTAEIPDPDLLIRTSGEMRISNFLLWQLAYTELYFTETLWPDFDADQLQLALKEYSRRQRRFGLTAAQIHGKDREVPH
jgi:undecaprenyl diphosphate synthase